MQNRQDMLRTAIAVVVSVFLTSASAVAQSPLSNEGILARLRGALPQSAEVRCDWNFNSDRPGCEWAQTGGTLKAYGGADSTFVIELSPNGEPNPAQVDSVRAILHGFGFDLPSWPPVQGVEGANSLKLLTYVAGSTRYFWLIKPDTSF